VKNPKASNKKATIHYHDIGDYLSQEQKLQIVKKFKSVANTEMKWKALQPNEHSDWLNQRNNVFDTFIPMTPEKKFDTKSQSYFTLNAVGINTARDIWAYGFNKIEVSRKLSRMIEFYNKQLGEIRAKKITDIDNFLSEDLSKIKWSVNLKNDIQRGKTLEYIESHRTCMYRPFNKLWLHYDKSFIERPGLSSFIFPNESVRNYLISISGIGSSKDFTALITDSFSTLDNIEKSQGFPLYYYEERQKNNPSLFDAVGESEYIRRDGVSDFILDRANKVYGKNVSKEDIFYYVYGILHSADYRNAFANDLKKMLPRLPLVEDVRDFWKFSKAGRALADLHIGYEEVPPYEGVEVAGAESGFYRVEKMRFPKKGQKDTIIYNSKIVVSNIPEKAYEYIVNGKSAIEWIMERYQITTHKESGIKNDPNDWAEEVGNPRYILDLLLSIINVSVQTVGIVEGLPRMEFET
jgi:predicted helicase